jgi:hypothetical protein
MPVIQWALGEVIERCIRSRQELEQKIARHGLKLR